MRKAIIEEDFNPVFVWVANPDKAAEEVTQLPKDCLTKSGLRHTMSGTVDSTEKEWNG